MTSIRKQDQNIEFKPTINLMLEVFLRTILKDNTLLFIVCSKISFSKKDPFFKCERNVLRELHTTSPFETTFPVRR